MTTDDKTPDPTPALLSTARLAEIRERVSYTVIAEAHNEAIADRAALLSHLDALTPRDREQGGRLVREVWIAWAKEQPAPKASWLVEWEGLSEPDREVDRRIFEACYAAGRASLTPRAPVDGEALGRLLYIEEKATPEARESASHLWAVVPAKIRESCARGALALHAIGYVAGRSEGEAERVRLQDALDLATADIGAEEDAQAEDAATIARLTAALRTETTMKEQVQDQLVEMRGKHREEWERTERLAGELAEAHDRATAFGVTVVESTEREAQKKIDALAAELAEARAARPHEPIADAALLAAKLYHDADNQSVQLAQIRVELDACRQEVAAARLDGAREAGVQLAAVAEIAASLYWTRANSDNPGDEDVYVDRLLALFPEQSATEGRQG